MSDCFLAAGPQEPRCPLHSVRRQGNRVQGVRGPRTVLKRTVRVLFAFGNNGDCDTAVIKPDAIRQRRNERTLRFIRSIRTVGVRSSTRAILGVNRFHERIASR